MMWRSHEPRYDVASAISMGGRDYQEDAITSDFLLGAASGFAIVADGMGGHAAGDMASKLVLSKVYGELKFQCANLDAFEAQAPQILREIADMANESLRLHIATNAETKGMGSTLVVPVIVENRLFWVSIGDSPLYRFRAGILKQLNADHSLAPQIDMMVSAGLMAPEVGRTHPDRNCLISALMGGKIAKIDCPDEPVELEAGDIILCGSDGMQVLSDIQIRHVLNKHRRKRSSEIAERLLQAVKDANAPAQDNISFCVVKINDASATPHHVRRSRPSEAAGKVQLKTRLVTENAVLQAQASSNPVDNVNERPEQPEKPLARFAPFAAARNRSA